MENSDTPGIRGNPGGNLASRHGRDSLDAHFFFADVVGMLTLDRWVLRVVRLLV